MPTVLITGCDTGLGREFARQYAAAGWSVLASYRDLSTRLADPTMRHFALDVTDFAQFAALKSQLEGTPIDLLLSNAGIGLETGRIGSLDFDYLQRIVQTNTVGPLKLVDTLVDNVAASTLRRIVMVSSRMGSIGNNLSGGHYGYRASKAGLNAIGRSLAIDLFPRGITVAMLHPGRVNTAGGGGADAPLSAEHSVQAMRNTIARMGNHETGVFCTYDGQSIPW
ncbi:MAG: SDR family oxidoreductase [Rhodoferax sp.]|nr:SDR family oxidoreductase [Rhodoferax sp.]